MAAQEPPLNWETTSAREPQVTSILPPDVTDCLKNARYLHLATCSSNRPHASLMNYTYLHSTPFSPHPTIIMTMNPSSKKTLNLQSNPLVSILVHDWISHRPPTITRDPDRRGSPPPTGRSALAERMLLMNTSALSRISVTMNGEARIVQAGSDEEEWCKVRHLENHTFREGEAAAAQGASLGESLLGTSPEQGRGGGIGGSGSAGGSAFMEGRDVSVVVVRLKDGRVSDVEGGIRDWILTEQPAVNGV